MLRSLTLLAVLTLCSQTANAQFRIVRSAPSSCPGGVCPSTVSPGFVNPVTQPFALPQQMPTAQITTHPTVLVECVRYPSESLTRWWFLVNGQKVGYLDEVDMQFTSVSGDKWRFAPPAPPEKQSKNSIGRLLGQMPPGVPDGGIDPEKLTPDAGKNRFRMNGREVNEGIAFEALTGASGQLADDSGFLRLTVIGSDADRKAVMNDLLNDVSLKEFARDMVLNDYPPDSWEVKQTGFRTDGHPTIYIQKPDGKVLHRQDDYRGGAGRLAGAIRKARPDYDPAKDPDLSKTPAPKVDPQPAPAPTPTPTPAPAPASPVTIPPWLTTLVAGILAFLYGRKVSKNAN